MHWNCALWEIQLTMDEVNSLLLSNFESCSTLHGLWSKYWSKTNHTENGSSSLFGTYWRLFAWNSNWYNILQLLKHSAKLNNPTGLWNRAAYEEEPHTMYAGPHSACFGWVHYQYHCRKLHNDLVIPSAQSAIWSEWDHWQWDESETSTSAQSKNLQDVGYETRFSKDIWERIYYKILWRHWNGPWYSGECWLYRLHWYLAAETSSLTMKKPKNKSRDYKLWMRRHAVIGIGVPWASLLIMSIHPWVAS